MGSVPGIVDPTPWRRAELDAKEAELAAATDDGERARIQAEVVELKRAMHGGRWRRLLGLRHLPW